MYDNILVGKKRKILSRGLLPVQRQKNFYIATWALTRKGKVAKLWIMFLKINFD